jgi:F-type H+-transporting ATPase subunit alpha
MKKVAGKLRLDLSQFRDLEAFAQFGSELDPDTQRSLARGERLVEMLNQKERQPLSVADQVASIYAGTGGHLDRIKTDRVHEFLERLLDELHSGDRALMDGINESGQLSDDDEKKLGDAIETTVTDFGPDFDESGTPLDESDAGGELPPEVSKEEDEGDDADSDGDAEASEESGSADEEKAEEVPA